MLRFNLNSIGTVKIYCSVSLDFSPLTPVTANWICRCVAGWHQVKQSVAAWVTSWTKGMTAHPSPELRPGRRAFRPGPYDCPDWMQLMLFAEKEDMFPVILAIWREIDIKIIARAYLSTTPTMQTLNVSDVNYKKDNIYFRIWLS